jgi:4-amino-4-deoxy-L-arabinose transferase-like glycosyltransferase
LIVCLLLVQFGLRIAHPVALPAYVDEGSHIVRSREIFNLGYNPLPTSHGKLLFYYWLGLFMPGDYGVLAVSRIAVALFSLVGSAGSMAVARVLFGRRAMIPVLAFYALAPYTLFFERMALADPFSGALAALAAWISILFARRPSIRRGTVLGLLLALAPMAKLTTLGIVALPALAIVLFGGVPLRDWRALRHTYGKPVFAAVIVFGVLWGWILGAALWMRVAHNTDAIIIDTFLIQDRPDLPTKLKDVWITAATFLSAPMTLLIIGLAALLIWKRRAAALYALIWLLLIWVPNTVFAEAVQPRYMMAGMPALAVIVGGGFSLMNRRIIAGLILGVWAVLFALPFAYRAATDPAALKLTEKDYYNYFWGQYNGWGIKTALDYLDEHGERIDGQIPVAVVMRTCGVYDLHVSAEFAGSCINWRQFDEDEIAHDITQWTPLLDGLERWPFVYVITEYLPLDAPPPDDALRWELLYHFERPHGGSRTVTIWRVERK